ncbi:MAG: hypothetical protein HZC01_01670 [Candidatus Kerfeldbacteria bacterium]|nr:hypothetical protein [Candidatus Kerfeldbacteria bacterium]
MTGPQSGGMPVMKEVGKVIRLFPNLGCVGIQVKKQVCKGDQLLCETHRQTHLDQEVVVDSMEVDHHVRQLVRAGERCAIKVGDTTNFHSGMTVFCIQAVDAPFTSEASAVPAETAGGSTYEDPDNEALRLAT